MRQRLATYTTLVAVLATPAWASPGPLKSVIARYVFHFFEAQREMSIDEFLERRRPEPLAAAHRAEVMAALPKEGELRPRADEIEKLDAAQKVLVYHARKGVITFKVIGVGHAFVGLHGRAVLLATRDALALVTAEQFSALVAHELAHEYVWDEYSRAMGTGEHSRLQNLELQCDGIAVLTLRRLGIDPEQLVSAVQSMTRFNERRGAVASANRYVSLEERVAFIRAVAAMRWGGPLGQDTPRGDGLRVDQTERRDREHDGAVGGAVAATAWPCRLILPPSLRPAVTVGWEHSATFRAQCRRLAQAGAIVILDPLTVQHTGFADARISVSADGVVVARARVPLNARTLEFVAHELEHVLERIEGVNLAMEAALSRSLTSRSGSAVLLPDGAFETRRAIEAGVRVAGEVQSATRATRSARHPRND